MNSRKRHVLIAAQQLFIKKGFLSTSIQDILDEAGISKGTFYNYFSSKTECLLAILENVREETNQKRQELLVGKDPSDKKVLSRQIAIRYIINREHNLFPIYEAIYYSKDKDLRSFMRKHYFYELSWLSERMKDVYGPAMDKHTVDSAIMLYGMIHHYLQVWKLLSKEEVNHEGLIDFVIRRIDAIVKDLIPTGDLFMDGFPFLSEHEDDIDLPKLKVEVESKLTGLLKAEEPAIREYADFLLEELNRTEPRTIILESILDSFRRLLKQSPEHEQIREMLYYVSRYAKRLK